MVCINAAYLITENNVIQFNLTEQWIQHHNINKSFLSFPDLVHGQRNVRSVDASFSSKLCASCRLRSSSGSSSKFAPKFKFSKFKFSRLFYILLGLAHAGPGRLLADRSSPHLPRPSQPKRRPFSSPAGLKKLPNHSQSSGEDVTHPRGSSLPWK